MLDSLKEKKRILEYANSCNIHSRFYIISIDIGNKQTVGDLIGGDNKFKIPKFYYAIKDFATGEIVSKIEENLRDALDFLYSIRDIHNEEHCSIYFYDHLETISNLKKEFNYDIH